MNKITNKVLLKLNISLFIVMGVIFFTNLVHILDLYIDVKKNTKNVDIKLGMTFIRYAKNQKIGKANILKYLRTC